MSRVVIFTPPDANHIMPLLPVVAELVERGEHITFYSTEAFRPMIETTGASFHMYTGFPAAEGDTDALPAHLIPLSIHLMRWTQALLPQLLADMSRIQPDFIIYDTLAPWGWALAQIVSVPAIASAALPLFNQTILMRTGKMYTLMRSMLSSMAMIQQYRQITGEIEAAYPVKFPGVLDVLNITGALTISYTTEHFQPFAAAFGSGMRFVGPVTSPDIQHGRRQSKTHDTPIIYVDGDSFRGDLNEVVDAFAGSHVRLVMQTAKHPDTPLPDNVTIVSRDHHYDMLQCASLVISAGDMISTHEAMYFNVPMLLLPETTLQSIISAQAVELGVALAIDADHQTATPIREQALAILHDAAMHQRSKLTGAAMRSAGGHLYAADEITAFMRKQSSFSGK